MIRHVPANGRNTKQNTMSHPTEHRIQIWVDSRDPADPSLADVREHLAQCQACQRVAEFLGSISTELRAGPPEPGPAVLAFAESLTTRGQTTRLVPLRRPAHRQAPADEPIVLAARSIDSPMRFRPIAVLASEDESMLLRVVHDAAANVYRISLRCGDMASIRAAIVEVAALDAQCIIDERGENVVPVSLPPPEDLVMEAIVRLPAEVIDSHPDTLSGTLALPQSHIPGIQCSMDARHLVITQDRAASPGFSHAGVFPADADPFVVPLFGPTNRILIQGSPSALRIRLYK
jgi:hypothetical protein